MTDLWQLIYQLTGLPGLPGTPVTPGGPMRVRLLIGQPCTHLARIDAAYWEIWAVTTPWHSCKICSSVSPGPCKERVVQVCFLRSGLNTFPKLPNVSFFLSFNNHDDTHRFTWLSFRPTLSFPSQVSSRSFISSGTWKTWRSNRTSKPIAAKTTLHSTLHIRQIFYLKWQIFYTFFFQYLLLH